MKNFLMLTIFMVGLFAFACSPPVTDSPAKAQTSFVQAADVGTNVVIIRAVDEPMVLIVSTPASGVMDFMKNNVAELDLNLLALVKIIDNAPPTKSYFKIYRILDTSINSIKPPNKAGCRKFT